MDVHNLNDQAHDEYRFQDLNTGYYTGGFETLEEAEKWALEGAGFDRSEVAFTKRHISAWEEAS